ncbi:MAG TPA: hypothetical protein VJM31_11770 [Vicinamibacterales bacterium]|nr:hypothetical protein [Vicinamibacterales bacterium]
MIQRAHVFYLLLSVFTLIPGAQALGQSVPQGIVDQFYPSRLSPADESERRSCFEVYASTNNEPEIIIAGYTDLAEGVVIVIGRDAPGVYSVRYEVSATYATNGRECEVELPDLDFDGQRDVHVRFLNRGGNPSWFFKWNGVQLTNITATEAEDGKEWSRLISASHYDINHSGWMHIVAPGFLEPLDDNQPKPEPLQVFESVNGMYERTRYLLAAREFVVGSDPWLLRYRLRQSQDSTAPFILRVVNGDRLGQRRVTEGTITIDNVVVVNSSQLTGAVEVVEVTLPSLPVDTVLRVSLVGGANSTILVTVADSTVRQP